MLRLAFDFIITWRETRTRPNAYLINALMPSLCLLSHTDIYYLLSDIYINIYLFPENQETAVFQAFSLPCHAQCSLYGFIPIAQSISPDYTIQT